MEVSSGEPEATATVVPFGGPGHVLRISALYRGTYLRISRMGAVRPLHRAFRSNRAQDGGYPLHAVAKTHEEIPFVLNGEGVDAGGDGVFGKLLELREPVRIHRMIDLKSS